MEFFIRIMKTSVHEGGINAIKVCVKAEVIKSTKVDKLSPDRVESTEVASFIEMLYVIRMKTILQ